jgi:hypothetical protein
MNINLTQAELNELIYALGIAQINGKMIRKDVFEQLDDKLFKALVAENARIQEQIEQDKIRRELNFKRNFVRHGDY